MISKSFVITVLILLTFAIYLFASRPSLLPEQRSMGVSIPIAELFPILEAENDVVRALWTKEIVGAGKQVGLSFNENWREEDVQAGPLPALFLRETANSLEKNPVRLSLYLGSGYPIKPANKFTAAQMEKFQIIRKSGEPQFFYAQDTGLHTAMFSDIAVVEACIDCHNKHKESPKSDWKLGDVMGATTWSYPEEAITLDELMKIVTALRQGFRDAYTAYLAKVEPFAKQPQVGDKWPRDGFYLPTVDVFMSEAVKRASTDTLAGVLSTLAPRAPQQAAASASNSSAQIHGVAGASDRKALLAGAASASVKTSVIPEAGTYEVAASRASRPTHSKSDEHTLALRAGETSWVEVVDSKGQRLFYALLVRDQEKRLSGKPPFHIVLGNADAVTLEYDGRPFSHSGRYRRGRVARFHIGD